MDKFFYYIFKFGYGISFLAAIILIALKDISRFYEVPLEDLNGIDLYIIDFIACAALFGVMELKQKNIINEADVD